MRSTIFSRLFHLYVYNTRIWQRYGRPAVSLALLVDDDPHFRPDQFVREKGGCRLTFTFPVVKLLSYKSEEELEADPNPLAVASLVQLAKLHAGSDSATSKPTPPQAASGG